jgi:YidC/Oxa1 family membrane protein insertase
MLSNAFELRGAKWMWWIKDLSQHDPYYILPILMGIGMLIQQKTSSQPTADPTQAKIMMLMPVIFTFMFLKFPSGLVLYWFTNSLLSMATQVWCNKKYAAA